MKEILETYNLPELKKMIRATNITGYSKLKKDELIKLMTRSENIDRFKSIKPKSARVPESSKPMAKVLKQLKKLYPAYKAYIEFYENTGFTKPKDLPPPPQWLIEGQPPPPSFKIPKIIITEIEEPKKSVAKKPQPKLPLQVQRNKKLRDLLKNKPSRVARSVYNLSIDLIDRLEDPSAKVQLDARDELEEQDELIQHVISIINPHTYYKSITVGGDRTGTKIIHEEEEEKRKTKEKRELAKKKKINKKK